MGPPNSTAAEGSYLLRQFQQMKEEAEAHFLPHLSSQIFPLGENELQNGFAASENAQKKVLVKKGCQGRLSPF